MIWIVLKRIVFVIVLLLLQISVIPGLPQPFSAVQAIIIALVMVALLGEFRLAYWYAIAFGIGLDMYAGSVFGSTALVLLLVVWIIDVVVHKFFATTTMYSVLLMDALGIILFTGLFTFVNQLPQIWEMHAIRWWAPGTFWPYLGSSIAINVACSFVAYIIAYYASNKFHGTRLRQ